jgi:hypothetical protein
LAHLKAFQTDIFPDALVPTVLAYQKASLSQNTGGGALRPVRHLPGNEHLSR